MVTTRALTILILLISTDSAWSATLLAKVDRKQITVEEHLLLTITLTNSDTRLRAQGVSPNIDLSLLTSQFDLGTPKATNRFNIYRNHGRSTSSISIELFPKKPGLLTIPSFSIDDLQTDPITIEVLQTPNPTPEVFTKSATSRTDVWVRQQLIAYIDLYHRVGIKEAKLGGRLDSEPFINDIFSLPQTERKEHHNGFEYNVTRIAWAIYPALSGRQTLYLPDLWIVTENNRRQRFPVQKQTITVKPLPATVAPDIIVGQLELRQTPLDNTPAAGQISSWQIILNSTAQADTLPRTIDILTNTPQLKIYRDTPFITTTKTPTSLQQTATYNFSLLPSTTGNYRLSPVEISFFNPLTATVETATLKERTIEVSTLAIAPQAPPKSVPPITTSHKESGSETSPIWPLLSFTTALLCIIFLTLWLRERTAGRAEQAQPSANSHKVAGTSPKQLLLDAFNSKTLEQGLYRWEQKHGNDKEVKAVIRAVQKACYGNGTMPADKTIRNTIKKIKSATARKEPTTGDSFYP